MKLSAMGCLSEKYLLSVASTLEWVQASSLSNSALRPMRSSSAICLPQTMNTLPEMFCAAGDARYVTSGAAFSGAKLSKPSSGFAKICGGGAGHRHGRAGARHERVRGDAVLGHGLGRRVRHRHDAGLGRGVVGLTRPSRR